VRAKKLRSKVRPVALGPVKNVSFRGAGLQIVGKKMGVELSLGGLGRIQEKIRRKKLSLDSPRLV
jgi:hypothetical protein